MNAVGDGLHMVRLRLEMHSLFELARRRRLPLHRMDTGYAAHIYLRELFGENAPMPFALVGERGRFLTVLGYCASDLDSLRTHARAFSDPAVYSGCDWAGIGAKPLPTVWPEGSRLGFEVRACPVVRKRSDGQFHRQGAEVDVFLSRCWDAGNPEVPVSREEVYREWFIGQVDRIGGATVTSVKVRGFQRQRMLRRDHSAERTSHTIDKPSALFSGSLVITNSAEFSQLVRRGIGRHRAFGFSMILLKKEVDDGTA